MKNLGLNKIIRFIGHYGDEARLVANALRIVASPFLDRQEREAVNAVIERMTAAADNIAQSLPELQKVSAIRIDKSDIKEALEELLPDIIGRVVAEVAKKPD
jgi:hypothetical protein